MGVSIRTIVNSVPKALLKQYFERHAVTFKNPIDWALEDKEINRSLDREIKALPKSDFDPIHAHLERIHVVANKRGIHALINASEKPDEMETKLKGMQNYLHSSMTIFLENEALFRTAEELLFFDFKVEGRSWQHCSIKTQKTLEDITQEDADAFAFQVANIFYRNYNTPDECCGEVYKRYSDGTRQISVYVNDFPSSDNQVKDRELHRIDTKKAIVAAIVYDPQTQQICTVADGGKDVHEKIRQSFAEVVLKQETEYTPIDPVHFAIEKFESRPAAPMLQTLPEHNIETVRVRKLDLFSNTPHRHIMTVDTMAQGKFSDMYANRAICDENGKLRIKYSIFHVVLSFHFRPRKEGKSGRTIHISLKKDGSDLKHLKEDDRQMIEAYLKSWKIIQEEEECLKTGTNG